MNRYARSAYPYISVDLWCEIAEIAPDKLVFVENGSDRLNAAVLQIILDATTEPLTVLVASNLDDPTPTQIADELDVLINNHPMLKTLYAKNALYNSARLKSLPIGPKWQYASIDLFGEPKDAVKNAFRSADVCNASDTAALFSTPRPDNLLIPSMSPGHGREKYLNQIRRNIDNNVSPQMPPVNFAGYLVQMRTHRFVFSPPGAGFDCHRHWEALMMGAIPIILSSDVDPMFDGLPVWLVRSYEEVTVESMKMMQKRFRNGSEWNFEKLFADYWIDLFLGNNHLNHFSF